MRWLLLLLLPVLCSAQTLKYVAPVTREAQLRFGIPAPVPVILAQIQTESGGNPLARSASGAMGLMQFMPGTATWVAIENGWGGMDAYNPVWAIRAGVWYDKYLYDRVKIYDTECDRWHFTLSGYNGGAGWVRDRQRQSPDPGNWSVTGKINPGIRFSAQAENERYSPRILYAHQPKFKEHGRTVCLP